MRRRDFITLVGSTALARPLAAFAAGPVRLIGVLMGYSENDLAAHLSSRRSAVPSRNRGGRKAAIYGSNFAGETVRRIR
jgi:hypothetical protein